jgi:hypothetical protein
VIRIGCGKHVNMVRHDAPSVQVISLTVIMKQRFRHDFGATRVIQERATQAAIQNFVGAASELRW